MVKPRIPLSVHRVGTEGKHSVYKVSSVLGVSYTFKASAKMPNENVEKLARHILHNRLRHPKLFKDE